MEAQCVSRYHRHQPSENQCSSCVVKHIKAPVDIVIHHPPSSHITVCLFVCFLWRLGLFLFWVFLLLWFLVISCGFVCFLPFSLRILDLMLPFPWFCVLCEIKDVGFDQIVVWFNFLGIIGFELISDRSWDVGVDLLFFLGIWVLEDIIELKIFVLIFFKICFFFRIRFGICFSWLLVVVFDWLNPSKIEIW